MMVKVTVCPIVTLVGLVVTEKIARSGLALTIMVTLTLCETGPFVAMIITVYVPSTAELTVSVANSFPLRTVEFMMRVDGLRDVDSPVEGMAVNWTVPANRFSRVIVTVTCEDAPGTSGPTDVGLAVIE